MLRDNYKILVVDDNYSVIIFLKRLLRSKFFVDVVSAPNGLVALKEIEKNNIAGIILDISMPEMNGIQFMEKIKQKEEFKNIPVLVLTAHGDKNTVTQLSQFKPDDFLLKPLSLATSLERIGDFINTAKLHICDYECGILVFSDYDESLEKFLAENKIPFTIPDDIDEACKYVKSNMPKAILLGRTSNKFNTEDVVKRLRNVHLTKWKYSYEPHFISFNGDKNLSTDIEVNSLDELLDELHRIFCGVTLSSDSDKHGS